MFFNFFIFLFISILIVLSTLGYGILFSNRLFGNSRYLNLPLKGIFGIFFLYLISSFTHLVFPHNFAHNSIIILLGLILFFKFLSKKNFEYQEFKLIIFFFICLFLGFLISKTNEDFSYYHLPNSLQFALHKLEFGLGNLNHGFKHFSSLFLINSLFYLPIVEFYLFNITNFMLQIFFFSSLTVILYKNYKNNFTIILSLVSLITYLTKFYRLSEYGSDYFGQFLVLLSFIILSLSFSASKQSTIDKKEVFLIATYLVIFAVTTKFLYVIYLLIPMLIIFNQYNFREIIKFIFEKKFFTISIVSLLTVLFFNYTATGCLIYPVVISCFTESADWSVPKDVINQLNLHYKAWSKAGIGAGYGVENVKSYLSSLNWIHNWIKTYFFNKVSDYIFVILFISLVLLFVFKKDLKKNNKINFKINISLLSYISILFVFSLWFFNFPSLRYAGYTVIFLLLVVPLCTYLAKNLNFNKIIVKKKIKILIIFALIIFNFKNIQRLNNELNLKNYEHHNFLNFPFYWVDNVEYKSILINGKYFYEVTNNKSCWNVPPTCLRDRNLLNIQTKNGYFFYKTK